MLPMKKESENSEEQLEEEDDPWVCATYGEYEDAAINARERTTGTIFSLQWR